MFYKKHFLISNCVTFCYEIVCMFCVVIMLFTAPAHDPPMPVYEFEPQVKVTLPPEPTKKYQNIFLKRFFVNSLLHVFIYFLIFVRVCVFEKMLEVSKATTRCLGRCRSIHAAETVKPKTYKTSYNNRFCRRFYRFTWSHHYVKHIFFIFIFVFSEVVARCFQRKLRLRIRCLRRERPLPAAER